RGVRATWRSRRGTPSSTSRWTPTLHEEEAADGARTKAEGPERPADLETRSVGSQAVSPRTAEGWPQGERDPRALRSRAAPALRRRPHRERSLSRGGAAPDHQPDGRRERTGFPTESPARTCPRRGAVPHKARPAAPGPLGARRPGPRTL